MERKDQILDKIKKIYILIADNDIEIKMWELCDNPSMVKEIQHQQLILKRQITRLMDEKAKISEQLRRK